MKTLKNLAKSLLRIQQNNENIDNDSIPIFDRPFYRDITDARINHLKTMNLNVRGKSVIDIGCGIGHFSEYFSKMNCKVFCIDGRSENIDVLSKRYPLIQSAVIDVESEELLDLGSFDIVFCYGLLYHLTNPFTFFNRVRKICREMIILETCIMDADDAVVRLVKEDQDNATQSLHPNGCRPSPAYVVECLKLSGFEHVYIPKKLPDHPQFKYKLNNDYSHIKNKHLIRGIYIASMKIIDNRMLEQC